MPSVAELAAFIADEMGASDEEVEAVRTAGRLHDIGKIGVHEKVLNKEGPLTSAERDHVRSHVMIGSQILAPLLHLGEAIAFVRSHLKYRSVPVIVLTTRGDEASRQAALQGGASAYLTKPFVPGALAAEAQQLLSLAAARGASR